MHSSPDQQDVLTVLVEANVGALISFDPMLQQGINQDLLLFLDQLRTWRGPPAKPHMFCLS